MSTILAPTSVPANQTVVSGVQAYSTESVVQVSCTNSLLPITTPCTVTLLLSSDGGKSFTAFDTKSFKQGQGVTSHQTFWLGQYADTPISTTNYVNVSGSPQQSRGFAQMFSAPFTQYLLSFAGPLGGAVTVSATGGVKAYDRQSVTLADAAVILIDLSLADRFVLAHLGGDRTLVVSNVTINQQFTLAIPQGTGGQLVTWWDGILWPNGNTIPTLSTAPFAVDIFTFWAFQANFYFGFPVSFGH